VQVVEDEHERPLVGDQLEEPAHRAVRAVALIGERGDAGRRPHRRQQLAELALELVVPPVVLGERVRGDVGVERVDEDAERDLLLELGRRPGEDDVPALRGARAQRTEEARLADPRLALDGQAPGRRAVERVEHPLETLELRAAPDERAGLVAAVHPGGEHIRGSGCVSGSRFRVRTR
jgi:hypothetical protein